MTLPPLPELHEKLDALTEDVAGQPAGLWHLRGQASAGKSTLLRALGARLAARELVPVLVAPPPAQLDTGGVALVEVGAGLRHANLINGELEDVVTAHRPWAVKLDKVRGWLGDAGLREKIVLLCDEPGNWPAMHGDEAPLGEHARDVADLLLDTRCRRVVTGRIDRALPQPTVVPLPLRSDAEWLANAEEWGDVLAPWAAKVSKSIGPSLQQRSPLDVRLLVALAAHRDVGRYGDASRRGLATDLWATLAESPIGTKTQRVWAQLALLRIPFDERLLEGVGLGALDSLHKEIVRRCLLFREDQRLVMHEMLRADARQGKVLDPRALQRTHKLFADDYTVRFGAVAVAEIGEKLRLEMEAYHHATYAGDVGQRRAFFADQLDALGRALSRAAIGWPRNPSPRAGRVQPAIDVFAEALRWDEHDDYAHHYYAYNRDLIAADPCETAPHFERAIEYAPGRVWWRARYVTFLITLARYADARRAWDTARDALGLPDASAPSTYEDLHVWVARLLIHRGQTEFAQDVLADVPPEVLEEHAGLRAMYGRLRALVEARARGAFTPGPYLEQPYWWKRGPFLLPARLRDGRTRLEWMAARVDQIHDRELHLRVARVFPRAIEPEIGALTLAFARFDRMSLDVKARELSAGRFLEIGKYVKTRSGSAAKDAVLHVRVHPIGVWEGHDLPPLFPDPARYARQP